MLEEHLKDDDVLDIELPKDLITSAVEVFNNLKLIYHAPLCMANNKLKILSVLPLNWSYNEIKKHFEASNHMIRAARETVKQKSFLSSPLRKKGILLTNVLL